MFCMYVTLVETLTFLTTESCCNAVAQHMTTKFTDGQKYGFISQM